MYTPAVGSGLVMEYMGQTGRDVLKGADMLSQLPLGCTSPTSNMPTTR